MILIPERPFDVERICEHLVQRHDKGFNYSIVVVAEGAVPLDAHPAVAREEATHARSARAPEGVGFLVRHEVQERTGFDTRVTILGHVQRGGTPVALSTACSPAASAWPRWKR